MRTTKHIAGFTLIEILAAIFIFAVMTLGIASTIRETGIITSKVKIRQTSVFSGQVALDRLQRDLQMAYNERLQGATTFFKADETGLGPELQFSYLESPVRTLFVRRTTGSALAYYHLEKEDNGTLRLERSEAPPYKQDTLKTIAGQSVATGILSWKMDYYDVRNDRWLLTWDTAGPNTPGYFPRAVRITIETIDPSIPKEDWKKKSLKFQTEFLVFNEMEVR